MISRGTAAPTGKMYILSGAVKNEHNVNEHRFEEPCEGQFVIFKWREVHDFLTSKKNLKVSVFSRKNNY